MGSQTRVGRASDVGVDFAEEDLDSRLRWTTDDGSERGMRKRKHNGGSRGCHGADLEDLEEETEHEMLGARAAVEPCYFFLVIPSSIVCRNE